MNQSPHLVSVVIPTFNRAHCVCRAVDSALAQTHTELEVVVVDDGSTDGTADLLQSRYSGDARVKCIHQSNAGVAAARNAGFAAAQGGFLALLDSDDTWFPWKLAAQLACFAEYPQLGMIWTDMQAVDAQGKLLHAAFIRKMYNCWDKFRSADDIFSQSQSFANLLGEHTPAPLRSGRFYYGEIFSCMFLGSLVHTSTVVLRRERLEQSGGFAPEMVSGEDYDFYLRICRQGPVGYLDVPTVRYEVGKLDRLSRHSAVIARNTLTAIETAALRDGDKLRLPPAVVRQRFAEVHMWLGEALLEDGQRRPARRHLARSLRYRPWQARCMRLLGLACVPPAVGNPLRATFRRAKRRAKQGWNQ